MEKLGQYIYAVIECGDERIFDAVPIGVPSLLSSSCQTDGGQAKGKDGEGGSGVYTICHNGLAAVVSNSEVKDYKLTRENMLAHQKVNETVMKEFVVLPVKFCTIAEDKDLIVKKLLDEKRDELLSKLKYLSDKQEFGLKVLWKEMSLVYAAIVEENPAIKKFKLRLEKVDPGKSRDGLIEIGEMVKQALEDKKEVVGGVVYDRLAKLAVEAKKNPLYGDKMPLNAAFLVARDKEKELDDEINKLAEENSGTMDWKYVGPTPAANFVEIVVTW